MNEKTNKFVLRFENYKLAMDNILGKFEYDPKNKKKLEGPLGESLNPVLEAYTEGEFTGTITTRGEVADLKVPDKLKKALDELGAGAGVPGLENMLGEGSVRETLALLFPVLPAEAVAKGKTWTNKLEVEMGGINIKVELGFQYDGPAKVGDKELEKLTLKPKTSFEADPNAPFTLKVKSEEAKAPAYFDAVAGRIAEFSVEQKLEMEFDVASMTATGKMKQTTTGKLVK